MFAPHHQHNESQRLGEGNSEPQPNDTDEIGKGNEDGNDEYQAAQEHEENGLGGTLHALVKANNNHIERKEYETGGKEWETFGAHSESVSAFGQEQ